MKKMLFLTALFSVSIMINELNAKVIGNENIASKSIINMVRKDKLSDKEIDWISNNVMDYNNLVCYDYYSVCDLLSEEDILRHNRKAIQHTSNLILQIISDEIVSFENKKKALNIIGEYGILDTAFGEYTDECPISISRLTGIARSNLLKRIKYSSAEREEKEWYIKFFNKKHFSSKNI